MPPIRPLALVLTLASLVLGCGSERECPATGSPLLSGMPELRPEYGPGCIDDEAWTAEVDPAAASWTVELRRNDFGQLHVAGLLDGVAVVLGTELILLDGEGTELTSRLLGSSGDWSNFVVSDQGQMILAAQPNGAPEYRVFAPTGVQVWLRLLDVDNPLGGRPGLALADDGSLWVALLQFTPDFQEIELVLQHWAVTGGKQSEVTLSGVSSQVFARDGVGRFLVIDDALDLFAADGTAIAQVDLGDAFASQIIGLADGFVVGGEIDRLPVITRIDGQGGIVWQRSLMGNLSEEFLGSFVLGVAALPDGGVVAVGSESTIEHNWPDSPITDSSQPFVIALDEDGVPTWGERLAVGGRATAVAVGSQGEVYVVGFAQGSEPSEYGETDEVAWLRRYDP